MASERGPQVHEPVERQDHLLSPPLHRSGRKLLEDFEVLADEGGGARDVAGRRWIQLLKDGQDFETDAIAGVLAGQVCRVRAIGLVYLFQVIQDLPARAPDEGALDPTPHGRDAGEPAQARAPRQVHEHGFGHVVGSVPRRNDPQSQPDGHLLGESVPLISRPLL